MRDGGNRRRRHRKNCNCILRRHDGRVVTRATRRDQCVCPSSPPCAPSSPVQPSFVSFFLFLSPITCSTVDTTTFQSVDDHSNSFDVSPIDLRVAEDHHNNAELTPSSSSLSSLLLSPSSSSSLELDSNHHHHHQEQKVCFVVSFDGSNV